MFIFMSQKFEQLIIRKLCNIFLESGRMLKKAATLFILFSVSLSANSLGQIINISNLYQNDQNGVPSLLNQIVTVKGEVTVSTQFYLPASIQDATGGIAIYDNNFATRVTIGDLVTISGTVTQFNGLTELNPVTILEHIKKPPAIQPQVVTCHDIATEGANGIENFEGKLVRINNATVNTGAWNVSSSGTNYILSDSTGSCEIRIDKDTNIANTTAPGGVFDVIGVIAQYDVSSPYTQGYQLMPRFAEDIIWFPATKITGQPEEFNMTSTSMDIHWTTETPSNSILIYGKTTNYEIDTIYVDESVLQHNVPISGLSPGTIYHVRAGSGQGDGRIFSNDHIVITASHPSSIGKMNVYFSQSVDKTYAQSKTADNVNILQKFIQRINAAKYSIDLCFYNITLEEVAQVLVAAKQRGVKVRVICDNEAKNNDPILQIKNAGIPVIDDSYGSNTSSPAMHNKFIVIDHQDTTSFSDDWVWMGSYNLSYSATYDNAENVIEIQDQALARCYTIEFDEMWGSSTATPNSATSRFGYRKTNNTPHKFNINGIEILQYMSPSDDGLAYLLNAIGQSQSSLYFCMLIFNQSEIANAMYSKWKTIANFKVKGVLDGGDLSGTQYFNMIGTGNSPWNPPADIHLDNERNLLHHKYLIIDSDGGDGEPILVTGSYNWSRAAENSNDENFLIIKDATIANIYLQEFAERYHKAGGKEDLIITDVKTGEQNIVPDVFYLSQNYPNPFNSQTTIEVTIQEKSDIELEIFNINGQLVRAFDLGFRLPGSYKVNWDGSANSGQKITGGIYISRLKIDNHYVSTQTRKIVYLP